MPAHQNVQLLTWASLNVVGARLAATKLEPEIVASVALSADQQPS